MAKPWHWSVISYPTRDRAACEDLDGALLAVKTFAQDAIDQQQEITAFAITKKEGLAKDAD